MTELPLHPLLVHFPIVLSVLLPLASLAALLAALRSGSGRKPWAAVFLVHALLLGSALLAVRTGERDEERVERVLASEAPLESHEEKAELFMKSIGAALLVAALGWAPGALGVAGKVAHVAASLAILFLGWQAGHTGGKLVYQYGAASAFAAHGGLPGSHGAPPEALGGEVGEEERSEGRDD